MLKKNWTSNDWIQLADMRQRKLPTVEIAAALGRSVKAVDTATYLLRKETKAQQRQTLAKAEVDEPRADYWQKRAKTAEHALHENEMKREAVDVLIEQAHELAPKSYQPLNVTAPRWISHPDKPINRPQSAVLMLSDTHIGQVVDPDETLGVGAYNFGLFLRRLKRLERSVFSILQDHTTTQVPEIVVAMLGDMLHGNLQHSVEAGQTNTLFDQFYCAGHALAQFLQRLATLAPVRVHTAVGNHTRWGHQKKMPTDNRYSNADQFLYAYTQALTRDIPTIQFNLDRQPFALFSVQGHQFFAGHGDNLRGGDRILGIPSHAFGRNVATHSQLASRTGRNVPEYYLFGHLHRSITLPHVNGEILVNGGFAGIDGYGLSEAFNSTPPTQRFFLMHPKFGRSACYDLRLDFGDTEAHDYSLPDTNFSCL